MGQIRLTDEGERAYIAIYLTVCASLPVRQRIEKCEVTVVTFLQKTYNSKPTNCQIVLRPNKSRTTDPLYSICFHSAADTAKIFNGGYEDGGINQL